MGYWEPTLIRRRLNLVRLDEVEHGLEETFEDLLEDGGQRPLVHRSTRLVVGLNTGDTQQAQNTDHPKPRRPRPPSSLLPRIISDTVSFT